MGMRRALYALVLIALAGSISARASQVPQPAIAGAKFYKPIKAANIEIKSKSVLFFYGQAEADGAAFRMSGGVKFVLDGTQVSASAADVDPRAGTISLRGDVTMQIR